MADWEDAPATKSSSGWEDAPASKAKTEGDSELYTKTYKALTEALPEDTGRTRVVGPMLAAGAGELTRGVGAATQLVFPETGKKISDVGRAVVEATKSRYPITGTVGQFGSYLYPYKAGEAAVLKVLPRTGTLGREAQIAGGAGALTGFTTQEGDLAQRTVDGAIGGILGMGVTYGGALASKGYQWTKKTLTDAFGGDAKRLSESLRAYSARLSGSEAQAAKQMADEIEKESAARTTQAAGQAAAARETAETAERAAGRAERQVESAYGELPGTKLEKEAGRFKPIPTSEESVGQRLKNVVKNFVDSIKNRRSELAEKNFSDALSAARKQEAEGKFVQGTGEFRKVTDYIDGRLNVVTDPAIRRELETIKTAITKGVPVELSEGERRVLALRSNVTLDQIPTKINLPPTFEGLEIMRRRIGDAAFGAPQEGYQAIGQDLAREIYGKLSDAMKKYSPDFATYLENYSRLSEPLRVTGSRVGKALVDEQLHGKGANYAVVAAEDIPKRVFKNRESYGALVDALGGNVQLAEAEAKKYFVGQMEKLAGDPKKLEAFIRDNRTMLDLTKARDMAESYFARASAFARRGAAAKARSAEELQRAKDVEAAASKEGTAAQSEANRLKDLSTEFSRMESQMKAARTPDEIARLHDATATRLFKEGKISQAQYEDMLAQGREVLQKVSDKQQAIRKLLPLSWRSVSGYGLVGAGVYGGIRYYGGQ
mgnify:CR=1 FL=1